MRERVRLVYRSRPVQVPLLAAIRACGAWEEAGIELASAEFVQGSVRSDAMLIGGECDVVFGSHISPYVQHYKGHRFVYLAQTVNWVDDLLVAGFPIRDARELHGRRIAEEEGVTAEGHSGSHPGGNHLLYLRRAGVDLRQLTFVATQRRRRFMDVADGLADAAFAPSRDAERAAAAGLHLLPLAPLPMVHGTTLTTLWSTFERRRAMCEGLVKAIVLGIHFVKTQPERMWEVMEREAASELGSHDAGALRFLHDHNRELLEPKPYPTPEAIANAFALALIEEPRLEGRLNPISLWDTSLVMALDGSGFIDRLYGGRAPAIGRVLAASAA